MIYPFSQSLYFLVWTITEKEEKVQEICTLPAQAFQIHSGVNQIQMLSALYSLGCKRKVKQPTERKQESVVWKNNSGYGEIMTI